MSDVPAFSRLSPLPWFEATARGLTGSRRLRWVQWSLTHSLYGPREMAKEEAALRSAIGRECGGWANDVGAPVVDESCVEDPYPHGDDGHAMTLAEIGDVLGCGPERVRQLQGQALRKLRRMARMRDGEADGFWAREMPGSARPTVRRSNLKCDLCKAPLLPEMMVSAETATGRDYFCNSICRGMR